MFTMTLRTFILIAMGISLIGCTTVVMNDGNTVVVEWDSTAAGKEQALEVATKSCKEAGKQSAVELTDVSTNPTMPSWMTTRKVTYKCQ